MNTIKLCNGYYIEIDALNHTLKQTYTGKDKHENPKESVRTIGYYNSIGKCIQIVLALEQLETDFDGDLMQYVKMVDESNKKAVQAIERVLSKLEDDGK